MLKKFFERPVCILDLFIANVPKEGQGNHETKGQMKGEAVAIEVGPQLRPSDACLKDRGYSDDRLMAYASMRTLTELPFAQVIS